MTKRIYVSPSDQVLNKYAYGNTNEAAQCRKIAVALVAALERCKFEAKTNIKDGSDMMAKRVAESNDWKADLHLCLHTNAFNEKVSGTRCFYFANNTEGHKVCEAIFVELAAITPGTSENIRPYPDLFEIKYTNAPCVYVEIDFHDVDSIAKWIIGHTTEIAESICEGICNHYGVKYIAPEAKPAAKPNKSELYRVQVGAFSKKQNALDLEDDLRTLGYATYLVADNGLYKVQVGAYSEYDNATNLAKKLSVKGFQTYITTKSGKPVTDKVEVKKKSNAEIAKEIFYGTCSDSRWGTWGYGNTRIERLKTAGYDPDAVQKEVNKLF